MPYTLQRFSGQQSLIKFVRRANLRLGRGTGADLRLDDPTVALDHALIEHHQGVYRLSNRGGASGTYLNGRPIQEAQLADDDLIEIGGFQIRVQVTHPDDPLFLVVRPRPALEEVPAAAPSLPAPAAEARGTVALWSLPAIEAPGTIALSSLPAVEAPGPAAPLSVPAVEAKGAAAPAAAAPPPAAPLSVTPAAGGQPPSLPDPPRLLAAADRPPNGADRLPSMPPTPAMQEPGPPGIPPGSGQPPASGQRAVPGQPPASPESPAAPSEPRGAPGPPRQQAPPDRPPAAPPPGVMRAPSVDYLRAFGLRRRFFNKALLSTVLALAAAAALLALPLTGRTRAFEPGGVHRWHAEVTSCASCHAPWRGAQPALCADCHASQRQKGEIHQARQILAPPCTSCHPEHRGGERLAFVDDGTCAACHADLRVTAGEPRFARSVHSFAADHPDFAVTLPDGRRLPLAEAVARRADPTPLLFDHRRHLRAGLPTPGGRRVQLSCESCHRIAGAAATAANAANGANVANVATGAGGLPPATAERPAGGHTGMVPVTNRGSCTTSGCHPLTFDDRRPDAVAPHDSPQRVREFLLSVYADRRARNQSVGAQYRLLVRSQGAAPSGLDFGAQAGRGVVLAERYLYGTACKECHLVDANATPLPVVTWTPIPQRWLPNARFSHLDHRASPCLDCHAAAPASTVAADVLLPGVAVCRRCHGGDDRGGGGGEGPPGAAVRPARTDCISCHSYHPRSPEAARTAAVPAPPATPRGG